MHRQNMMFEKATSVLMLFKTKWLINSFRKLQPETQKLHLNDYLANELLDE